MQTGRCWYCGSEDVEDYTDGSHECLECGMTWGGRQYVQQTYTRPARRQTYQQTAQRSYCDARKAAEWERSMRPYREKWRRMSGGTVSNGNRRYNAAENTTQDSPLSAIAYILIAIVIYGILGITLFMACTD